MSALAAAVVLSSACSIPYFSNLPSTPDLINGAATTLESARSVEISGSYAYEGLTYALDEQLVPPFEGHFVFTQKSGVDEAIQYADRVYWRGYDALSNGLGYDPREKEIMKALGTRWFTNGGTSNAVDATWVMSMQSFRATFLSTLLVKRRDHVTAGGFDAAELSTSSYVLVITEQAPHRLLLIKSVVGKTINNVTDLVLALTNYNGSFDITEPADAVDLQNRDTWPPLYERVSIDGSRCSNPCLISAVFENYGGTVPHGLASAVSFTLSKTANGNGDLGRCTVTIHPDVAYQHRTAERCAIPSAAWYRYGKVAYYNAVVHNPAYE